MRVYLASAYERKNELRVYRENLRRYGHNVQASWLDEREEDLPEDLDRRDPETIAWRIKTAMIDMREVGHCDVFICFIGDKYTRGGRHVEFGRTLCPDRHIRSVVVGSMKGATIFHELADAHYISFKEMLDSESWITDHSPRNGNEHTKH